MIMRDKAGTINLFLPHALNFVSRPVLDETEPLNITFGITLQQIIDVVKNPFHCSADMVGYFVFEVYVHPLPKPPACIWFYFKSFFFYFFVQLDLKIFVVVFYNAQWTSC